MEFLVVYVFGCLVKSTCLWCLETWRSATAIIYNRRSKAGGVLQTDSAVVWPLCTKVLDHPGRLLTRMRGLSCSTLHEQSAHVNIISWFKASGRLQPENHSFLPSWRQAFYDLSQRLGSMAWGLQWQWALPPPRASHVGRQARKDRAQKA
jgi:hypothetical protein